MNNWLNILFYSVQNLSLMLMLFLPGGYIFAHICFFFFFSFFVSASSGGSRKCLHPKLCSNVSKIIVIKKIIIMHVAVTQKNSCS